MLRYLLALLLSLFTIRGGGLCLGEARADTLPSGDVQPPPVPRQEKTQTKFIEWSTSNLQYLYGFNWDLGKATRDTLTLEHADAWRYGDNYFFLDVYNLAEHDRELGDAVYYGELHPRFSLNKIFERDLSYKRIKEVLISNEFTFAEGFLTHSTGVGFSVALSHFDFANVNFLMKDNVDQDGVTWQVILDWSVPFTIHGLKLSCGGYIDVAGPEGNLSWTTYSDIQLLLDVGTFFNYHNRLFAGVEFRYIRNEFGIPDQEEFVPQPMVKWTF